jgi:hypothetical protein
MRELVMKFVALYEARNRLSELVAMVERGSEDGSRQETHTRYDALQAFPQEAMWYLDQ